MEKEIVKYSWVETHKELVKFLANNQNNQKQLIDLLKKVGITGFKDKDSSGDNIELEEIDPFTFFCYIYKHGDQNRLNYLQKIAEEINILPIPTDDSGIPSAYAQKVWLFPYKAERNNNEISRLWNLFFCAIENRVSNEQFENILKIKNIGKTKLTEALFNINPEKYFPIDKPTKPYLKEKLEIEPKFNTYTEYLDILKRIRGRTDEPFYKLSYKASELNSEKNKVNYWIFQGNPDLFDFETALTNNLINDWHVSAYKEEIKKGDKVILWITGKKSGCYAFAEVTQEPRIKETSSDDHLWETDKKNELKAGIKVTNNLVSNPITKEQIDDIEELSELKVGNQGTNFSATEEEYLTLLKMAETMNSKKYWLFAPGKNAEMWDEFCEQGIMGLGWDTLGDLNNYKTKEEIVVRLQELENTKGSKKNDATANYEFKEVLSKGDVAIVKKGIGELLGYGVVASDYFFDHTRNSYQKCRKIDWKKKGNWKTDFSLVPKTLTDITKYPTEHPDYEYYYERLLGLMDDKKEYRMNFPLNTIFYGPPGTGKTRGTILRAAQIIENRIITDYEEAMEVFNKYLRKEIEFITFHQNYSYEDFIQGLRPDVDNGSELRFERKDGVFKRISDRAHKNLLDSQNPKDSRRKFEDVFNEYIKPLKEKEELEVCMKNVSFFITGITPKSIEFRKNKGESQHSLSIETLRKMYEKGKNDNIIIGGLQHYYDPILTKLLEKSKSDVNKIEQKNYVIIIDEINRANISRVFGELITLIEPDKRSHGAIPRYVN